MRLAVTITMALSLVAGAAFAKTPYHDGTAEVIKPTIRIIRLVKSCLVMIFARQ
jgi:endoglucanase Acf2